MVLLQNNNMNDMLYMKFGIVLFDNSRYNASITLSKGAYGYERDGYPENRRK